MKRLFRTKTRKILALLSVLALAMAAAAIAAWLVNTPATNGRGKVGTLGAPTCSAAATFSGALLAPGSDGDANLTCSNPNGVPLTLVSAGDNGGGSFAPSNPATCPATNFSFKSGGTTVATPQVLPANATNLPITINNLFHLATTAPVGCAGQDVVQTGGVVISWST